MTGKAAGTKIGAGSLFHPRGVMDGLSSGRDATSTVLDRVAAASAAQMSAENFPVAMRLLPAAVRADLARIYAYARFVDDVGDEAPGDRSSLLDEVDVDVHALYGGAARFAPVIGLRSIVRAHSVPMATLIALIEANRVDQTTSKYETFDDLLDYCRLSAAPIGQLVLSLADSATPQAVIESDSVCAALQVLEHCQDVGEDARAGRVYLPAVDLRAAGIADDALRASFTSPALRGVVRVQVDRARSLLGCGRPLVRRLHGWSRIAVAGYVAGGLATADALVRADYDVLARKIEPSRTRTAYHAVRLISHTGLTRPRGARR